MRTLTAALPLLLLTAPASAAPGICVHTAGQNYATTVCQTDIGDGNTDYCPGVTTGAPLPTTGTSVCVDLP